ncbi:hypothetical protein Tco_0078507 [Tanacetum coccineum]
MGGSYYLIPCTILSTEKDRKTPQCYPDVPTTSWRIFIRSIDLFQGLTPKSPSSWHRPLALNDLAIYDNESWNDPRDFAKPVKAITLPQDVLITTLCKICSGPYDTQYCMEDPEQAFVNYASSCTDEAGDKCSINAIMINPKQQGDSHNDITKENEEEEKDSPKNTHFDSSTPPDPSISFIIEKFFKFNSLFKSLRLVPPSPNAELVCTKEEDGDVMFIDIIHFPQGGTRSRSARCGVF